jgi:phosphatidylglycerol lysyltransferase
MEPMHFLVAVEPFHAPREHIYLVAERNGAAIQFLSAVPIYGRSGWLMEDMLRGRNAPNGTTELMIDHLMWRLGGDPYWVTPGLTPLAGPIPWWLRCTRAISSPLYDFSGLRRFRARLQPSCWKPVWLVWDRGPVLLVLLDVLRAFAGGRLVGFASRTILNHPNGPPWAVGLPLAGWIVLLAGMAVTGHGAILGFAATALWGWIAFDILLAMFLFRAARRPRPPLLGCLTVAAAFDATASWAHLFAVGIGGGAIAAAMRLLATAGPTIGTAALGWATHRALAAAAMRRSG